VCVGCWVFINTVGRGKARCIHRSIIHVVWSTPPSTTQRMAGFGCHFSRPAYSILPCSGDPTLYRSDNYSLRIIFLPSCHGFRNQTAHRLLRIVSISKQFGATCTQAHERATPFPSLSRSYFLIHKNNRNIVQGVTRPLQLPEFLSVASQKDMQHESSKQSISRSNNHTIKYNKLATKGSRQAATRIITP
jgi:hypothetical protein